MSITWLADALRGAGLTVVEHAGWRTRSVSGSWSPTFGIVHATAAPASQSDTVQIRIVRDGRSDLDGPIANACVDRAGRWHVLAGGRCNTTLAGTAGPYAGKGNSFALGVEACNDNRSEPWSPTQYSAYVRGWAAIAKRMGWGPDRLRGHKEHTPGHKTDPTFNMATFRADVARVLAGDDEEDALMALSERDQESLIWRVEALVNGRTTVAGGPTEGEAVAPNRALAGLAAGVAALQTAAAAEVQRDADLRTLLEQHQSGEVSAEEVVQRLAERLAA